ncbi:NAC domain-containing protein 4 isoform X2 [Prunus yedoensis var. nudiflora]|uniref:NAC domain-containing protein 4 isoform X2 n=1 Tax=Prunus yedoensis var. nudiflora TaxID=2094558 RepID=A0A314URK8_PRUYE|nr:NAC domain-containing protein 4 isoform X2 [Prunus yedoensis var. nudiflora]
MQEDTRPPENGDYFERARDLLLANSLNNNDHNVFPPEFSANDQEFLRTLIVEPQFRVTSDTDREPVHHRVKKCSRFAPIASEPLYFFLSRVYKCVVNHKYFMNYNVVRASPDEIQMLYFITSYPDRLLPLSM